VWQGLSAGSGSTTSLHLDLGFPEHTCSEQASSLDCHPQDGMLLRLIPDVPEGHRASETGLQHSTSIKLGTTLWGFV